MYTHWRNGCRQLHQVALMHPPSVLQPWHGSLCSIIVGSWGDVETDVCMASPGPDSLMLRGLVELAQTLLKGHLMLQDNYCHGVACQGARELLKTWSKSIWPPGLVEWSRPGVGKILLGLVTNPSSMYPRVVSMVCKDQSVVRDVSISKHRVESVILWCTVATYVPWLREGSLSQVSCPKQRVVTVFCHLHRENHGLFCLSHHSKHFLCPYTDSQISQ